MSRKSEGGGYPPNWRAIATRVKDEAGWCCVRCRHPHEPALGYALTVHHLNMRPEDSGPSFWWNLLPLCQRCHLHVQGVVDLRRPWVLEHSDWFKPYVAGWYAAHYLGEQLTRPEVEARLDELLALEPRAVLPWVYPS